jgi:hypothetical protein
LLQAADHIGLIAERNPILNKTAAKQMTMAGSFSLS